MKVKSESEVAQVVYLKVIQSCPTPRDPMDCSLPGSSVHGIFQARVLEWSAIAFSGNDEWLSPNVSPEKKKKEKKKKKHQKTKQNKQKKTNVSPGMAVAGLWHVDPHNYTTWLRKVPSPGTMTTSIIVDDYCNRDQDCPSAVSEHQAVF